MMASLSPKKTQNCRVKLMFMCWERSEGIPHSMLHKAGVMGDQLQFWSTVNPDWSSLQLLGEGGVEPSEEPQESRNCGDLEQTMEILSKQSHSTIL